MLKQTGFHAITQQWFRRHFREASPPQVQGWPVIASGSHCLICAPTGSGKTLAAFLWCIDTLLRQKINNSGPAKSIHTLYISPLKALNNDIERNLRQPLSGLEQESRDAGYDIPKITALVRTGDTPSAVRQKMLRRPPDILITTPESLYLLLTSEKGRHLFSDLRYIIVDEIHAICGNKRGVHLSLSLERLMPLCQKEPVRIGLSATQKPLERVAAFLGGFSKPGSPRPVEIVDTGQRKQLDVRVISPVASYSALPEASIWPDVYKLLYDLIQQHKTTLIFVPMRAQSEKTARLLNELHYKRGADKKEALALAHHGSLSRETRFEVESRLKSGTLKAVVATGSLELGIDIGSIDLVVQLESPKSVSSALQRVGRSGHLLKATSKGRIIPLYRADLDDCVALARAMLDGNIEETRVPENALDVLAQQIVAEVACQNWKSDDLYDLVCCSYCYRSLSRAAFDRVLKMLQGELAEKSLSALQPRLNFNIADGSLKALPGSRLSAVMNSGTIPDRAYYGVYLAEGRTKIGEMEEEFVFESKPGDVFYLGNSEYRIEDIRQDRLIVSLHNDVKPRPPFWKGDLLYRDYDTGRLIATFHDNLQQHVAAGNGEQWLQQNYPCDEAIARSLVESFKEQNESGAGLAGEKQLIVEHFRDSAGEPLLLLQSPFGARINGLWAIALGAVLERQHGLQVQYTYNDEAMMIRLLHENESEAADLFNLSTEEMEQHLVAALIDSPMFAIRFRYNAARALMLPRSQPGKRVPLWLQRLRSADVLQAVRSNDDFPIIVETYRECLYDLFDWPGLQTLSERIRSGEIGIVHRRNKKPSPMAAALLFRMISDNMYETDRSRQPAQGINFTGLLADILQSENIARLIDADLNARFEQQQQFLTTGRRARDAESLLRVIETLAPVSEKELVLRCDGDITSFIKELSAEKRIVLADTVLGKGWIAAEQKTLFDSAQPAALLRQLLRGHAAVTIETVLEKSGLEPETLNKALNELRQKNEIVHGKLIEDSQQDWMCDRVTFARMYRAAIAARRRFDSPLPGGQWSRFLWQWQNSSDPETAAGRMAGFSAPYPLLLNDIIGPRLAETGMDESLESGAYILQLSREGRQAEARVIARGSGYYWQPEAVETEKLSTDENTIRQFLKENGASTFEDLAAGCELSFGAINRALSGLLQKGIIGNTRRRSIDVLLNENMGGQPKAADAQFTPNMRSTRTRGLQSRINRRMQGSWQLHGGQWFLQHSFAVQGKKRNRQEIALFQARLLLNRYGVVVKECYRREKGLLPWIELFNTMKTMEWQGLIRRGYFIEGLSGIQFALPEVLEHLRRLQNDTEQASRETGVLLSVFDPALPYGTLTRWPLRDDSGREIRVSRVSGNYIFFKGGVRAYVENRGRRITLDKSWEHSMTRDLVLALKQLLARNKGTMRRIRIETIDDKAITESPRSKVFLEHGFEKNGDIVELWPSAL